MPSKKQINKANSLIAAAVVVVIILVINLFSYQLSARFDATENKDYSVSEPTRNILAGLDDVVNIKAYFTSALPGYLSGRNQDVRDILGEYAAASSGNIRVTYLDPSVSEDIKKEAAGLGIPTLQFNVVEKDKYAVQNGYLGLAIFYGDNKEIIPIVQDSSTLEYDLTAAVSRVTRDEIPTIAFVSGFGAWERGSMEQVWAALERQYRVRAFDLAAGALVPEEIDTLLVPGVKQNIGKRGQYILDQFLMRGGDILVMEDGVAISNADLSVEKLDTGLGELLANWGIRLNKDLVLDVSNEIAAFRTDQTQFFSPYPFWVKVGKAGFNPESGIVNKLESFVATWSSSLEILSEKLPAGTEAVELVKTTSEAWTQDGTPSANGAGWDLNPRAIPLPEAGQRGPRVLAVQVSGRFASLFSKDSIPQKDPATPVASEEKDKFLGATDTGRIIVVSDADLPTDTNLQRFSANGILFLNLVDALASDESLIAIRSKGVTDRPLNDLSDGKKAAVKWGNILGIPAVFVIFGALRQFRRKRKKISF